MTKNPPHGRTRKLFPRRRYTDTTKSRSLADSGVHGPLRSVVGSATDPAFTARAWSLMSDLVR